MCVRLQKSSSRVNCLQSKCFRAFRRVHLDCLRNRRLQVRALRGVLWQITTCGETQSRQSLSVREFDRECPASLRGREPSGPLWCVLDFAPAGSRRPNFPSRFFARPETSGMFRSTGSRSILVPIGIPPSRFAQLMAAHRRGDPHMEGGQKAGTRDPANANRRRPCPSPWPLPYHRSFGAFRALSAAR
jgi:hypothetical protein